MNKKRRNTEPLKILFAKNCAQPFDNFVDRQSNDIVETARDGLHEHSCFALNPVRTGATPRNLTDFSHEK